MKDTKEFVKILKAAINARESMWSLADAVLEAVPASTSGVKIGLVEKLNDISSYLAFHKLHYSVKTLQMYRLTAYAFPPGERIAGVSLNACQSCRNPDTLNKVLAEGIPLNNRSILAFRRKIRNKPLFDQERPGTSTEKISNLSILLSRAFELGNRAEKISRGKTSATLAREAISISDCFARVAAMLSPARSMKRAA